MLVTKDNIGSIDLTKHIVAVFEAPHLFVLVEASGRYSFVSMMLFVDAAWSVLPERRPCTSIVGCVMHMLDNNRTVIASRSYKELYEFIQNI